MEPISDPNDPRRRGAREKKGSLLEFWVTWEQNRVFVLISPTMPSRRNCNHPSVVEPNRFP